MRFVSHCYTAYVLSREQDPSELPERIDETGKKLLKEYEEADRGIEFLTYVQKALNGGIDDDSFRSIETKDPIHVKRCQGYQKHDRHEACKTIVVWTKGRMRNGHLKDRCNICRRRQTAHDFHKKRKTDQAQRARTPQPQEHGAETLDDHMDISEGEVSQIPTSSGYDDPTSGGNASTTSRVWEMIPTSGESAVIRSCISRSVN
jgi:hypothetical protein